MMKLADQTTAKFEAVDSFVEIAEDVDRTIMVQVRCDGLPDELEWTCLNAEHMYEDIPDTFPNYIDSVKNGPSQF